MIPSTLLLQSLTFMAQPINRYKGTLPYLLMNVGGALLQMGLAQWCTLIKQPHPRSPKVNNSSSDGSVAVSVSHSKAEVSATVDIKHLGQANVSTETAFGHV